MWDMQVRQGIVVTYARCCRRRTPAPVHADEQQERSTAVLLKSLRPAQVMRYLSASLACWPASWRPLYNVC